MAEKKSEGQEIVDQLARMQKEGKSHETRRSYFTSRVREGRESAVSFDDVIISRQDWTQFDLAELSFRRAKFLGCNLDQSSFNASTLDDAIFTSLETTQETPDGILKLEQISLTRAIQARFGSTHAERTTFECLLNQAEFTNAVLTDANFSQSRLHATKFSGGSLEGANFRGARINAATAFANIDEIKGASIDRYSLACLGSEYGGLTEGNRMDMKVFDDVAELRASFGGLWGVLHLAAMVVFLAPYVRFLAMNWMKARFLRERNESMTLLEALARFIVTGGENWQHSWWPNIWSLVPFAIYLTYNVARGALLWKTKKLETQQEVSGLPVRFLLAESAGWSWCYKAVQWLFYLAIIAVAVNTGHFLMMRVPIDAT